MSQVLRNLQFVTQSFAGTPSTGTGVMFASGSKLYFENATGSIFPLGGPGYIIVREYTGSNPGGGTLTYTWNTPVNIKYIQVICVGAGGGGGSGRSQTGIAARTQGGSGGGGGAVARGFFDRRELTQPSYTISVGGGGAGGASVSGVATGNTGTDGRYTTFGETMVSASGGFGGSGGPTNSSRPGGPSGVATACRPGPAFAVSGGLGAGTSGTGPALATTNFFSTPLTHTATAGGGAGGGFEAVAPTSSYSGSAGAGGFQWNTLQANGGSFGKPATPGSDNLVTAAVLLQFTSSVFTTTYGLGGGGSGGDHRLSSVTATGYAGSNGGLYGAGGGGGGAINATSGTPTSGAGGSGSSGLCIVVEYY